MSDIILSPRKILILALIGWFIQWLWVSQYLGHDYLLPLNDVRNYWHKSNSLQSIVGPFHVPLYSLLIWALRLISFNSLSPMIYMQGVNLIAFICALIYLYKIAEQHLSRERSAQLQLLFIFYPVAGMSYVVSPYADMPAIALLLAAVFYAEKKSYWTSLILFAFAMLCHKFLWPLIGIYLAISYFRKKAGIKHTALLSLSYLSIPLYWLAGLKKYQSANWIFSSNLEKEFSSADTFYPIKGLVDLLFSESFSELALGILLVGLLTLIIVVLIKFKQHSTFTVSIAITILLFMLILNKEELFVLIRFSKIFLPFALIGTLKFMDKKPALLLAFILLGISSNLALAWYAFS